MASRSEGDGQPINELAVANMYSAMRTEHNQIYSKITELEMEVSEHSLVINAIQPLDPSRRCYRMIGGVLVERTIKEVLPAVQRNKDGIEEIFTNSDRNHAIKVLNRLGLQDCFEQIICFETLNPNLSKSITPDEFPVLLKPSPDAFKIAVDVADLDPTRTLFLDDNVKNIVAGKAVGFCTALIGKKMRKKEADCEMEKVSELLKTVPEIWVKEKDGGEETLRKKKIINQQWE